MAVAVALKAVGPAGLPRRGSQAWTRACTSATGRSPRWDQSRSGARARTVPGAAQGSQTAPSSPFSSLPANEAPSVPRPPSGPLTGPALVDLLKRFKRLQNGSDIRGIAIEGVPDQPVTLTPGAVFFIGHAFAQWLEAKYGDRPSVSTGRDPRVSGPLVETAFVAGLLSGGAREVHSFGLATTPCMFYSTIESGLPGVDPCTAGVMITASHMPFNANGLKFFTAEGGLEKADITDILQRATQAAAAAGVLIGEGLAEATFWTQAALQAPAEGLQHRDFLPVYAASLRDLIRRGISHKDSYLFPLVGLKIVVDAGNGSGGFFADQVLAPLGADVAGSRFLDPDGAFPNHIPNPEHPSAMASGREAVLQGGADLGIVFDTDVDRSAIVDSTGREINSNRFIALMAAVVLREHPGSTVVTDSVTSNGLTAFIEQLGGKHCRYMRGYKNVISKGRQLNAAGEETHLMMETSGHGAIKANRFLDDGAYLATKVVIELVRRRQAGQGDIGDLLKELKEPAEAKEVRIKIQSSEFKEVGSKVLASFKAWVDSGAAGADWTLDAVNHEGWRVNVDEGSGRRGWLLLRQSLHDPLLVLNVESEVAGGVKASMERLLNGFILTQCQGLPLDVLLISKAVSGQ